MVITNKEIASFTFETGKNFVELFYTFQSGSLSPSFSSEQLNSAVFSASCELFVSQMRSELNLAIESLIAKELVIVSVDYNGIANVIGRKGEPAFVTGLEGGTGTAEAGQRNGYTITISQPFATGLPDVYTGDIADLLVAGV